MKNILVPTDFSKNATEAAHYAATIAQVTGARLLLFHAYHVSVAFSDASSRAIDLDLENFENLNQTEIDSLAYDLHKTYGISVTRIMRPGFAPDEIPGIASRLKADLIVMGMRGKSETPSALLGSTVKALLLVTKVPVLCLPMGIFFEGLQAENIEINSLNAISFPGAEALCNLFRALKLTGAHNSLKIINRVKENRLEPAVAESLPNHVTNSEMFSHPVLSDYSPETQPLAVIAAGAEAEIIKYEQIYHPLMNKVGGPLLAVPVTG